MKNKETKFRFWHDGVMYDVFGLVFDAHGLRDVHVQLGGNRRFFYDVQSKNYAPLMQFTGLIDKNGVEIYEGDIVKMPGASQAMWVEYQPPEFVMRHKTKSGRKSSSWSTFDLDYRKHQFVEVIGNIYEHPHLMQEK